MILPESFAVSELNLMKANQTALRSVWFAFFFCFRTVVLCILIFAQQNDLQAQSVPLPKEASSWTGKDFSAKLQTLHKSLTSNQLEAFKAQQIAELRADQRQEFFDGFLQQIFASEDYAKAQMNAWMLDHFQIDNSDPESLRRIDRSGWDTDSYRKWLTQNFTQNTRFDEFLQSQLLGIPDPASGLPTYAWYLAGQWSNYRITESLSPIESNLIRQFQTALDSIHKTETKDWERLVEQSQKDSNEIKRWWQSLRTWPVIPSHELVWSWPEDSDAKQAIPNSLREPPEGQALRGFREWTLVIDTKLTKECIDSIEPIVLFVQSQDGEIAQEIQRTLLIELRQGRLCVSLIHDARISYQEIQTDEALPSDQAIQIAIVNDGLGRSDSIRILVNGQTQSTKPSAMAKGYLKEMVSGKENRWKIGQVLGRNSQIEQVQVYRLALSPPECRGLAQSPWMGTWEEMNEPTRIEWVEHYARRLDAQWRYQRESRSHYVANLAAVKESASMVPVIGDLDQPIFLTQTQRFPCTLRSTLKNDAGSPSDVLSTMPKDWSTTGKRWEIEEFARTEAIRTWRAMHRYADVSRRASDIPEDLVLEFTTHLDRKRLLGALASLLLLELP